MINSRWSIVAYGAAALLGVLMVALALVELGDDSRTPPRASVVAFAVHDEVTGAYVQAQILDVDPNDPSADLSMYLRFTFGTSELPAAGRSVTPIHTVTAASEAVSRNAGSLVTSAPVAAGGGATGKGASSPEHTGAAVTGELSSQAEGASIVLAGPLARGLKNCNDEDTFTITKGLEFDDLSNLEQKAVIEYLRTSEVRDEVAEGASFPEAADVVSADALALAVTLGYTAIEPTYLYPLRDPWTLTSDSDETTQLGGWFNYLTCQLDADVFWSDYGTRKVFTFPAVVASSASAGETASTLEVLRRVQILPAPYMDLVYAEGIATDTPAGNARFQTEKESWTTYRPVVINEGFRLSFEDLGGLRWREWSIFLAGIGVSILATISALVIVRWSTRSPARAAPVGDAAPDDGAAADPP